MRLILYGKILRTSSLFADRVALGAFIIDGRQEGTDRLLTGSNKLNLTRNLNSKMKFCKRNGHLKIRNVGICVVNIVVLSTASI
jgi:hypothetical protein